MDFFEQQDRARRRTRLLVFYYGLALVMIVFSVYLAVLVGLSFIPSVNPLAEVLKKGFQAPWLALFWQPGLFCGTAAVTLSVIGVASLLKVRELAGGGWIVATSLGGRRLDRDTQDPDERRLLNVVEETAIASGVPVPEVYVLDDEKSINAFAAGYTTSDAVIGVTRGGLRLLNRDELQGVLAHEFSHILNGDMRLNLRLIGLLHGIMAITLIGRVLTGSRGNQRKGREVFLGAALLVIGSIGVFFGRLIQSAVSRQREFLADAAAIQFTRNPSGLAGALKKIGGLAGGSALDTPMAEEASHLFFSDGLDRRWFGLTASHPSIETRIRRIDPDWDGVYPVVAFPEEPVRVPLAPKAASAGTPAAALPAVVTGAAAVAMADSLKRVGSPTAVHLDYARQMLASLPESVRADARTAAGAAALVYALLLSADERVRNGQFDGLKAETTPEIFGQTGALFGQVAGFDPAMKLPVVELAIPALRRLPPDEYARFKAAVKALIEADQQIDLFEYCLQKLVLRHLDPHFEPARRPIAQYYSLKPVLEECAVLLSAFARMGDETPGRAEAAFREGAQQLAPGDGRIDLLVFDKCNLPQIDAALDRLAELAPPLKKRVLRACAVAAAADGFIQPREAELLRATADTLDCPIPPFVTVDAEAA